MKEEEIIWYEENWNRHKTGRKAQSHRRVWKLTNNIWDEKFEGGMSNENFRNCKCWKKKRKTQYLIKPVIVKKTRKPKEREHWRYKKPYHACGYIMAESRKSMENRKKYDSYSWDKYYSALGFMEDEIKYNDILVSKRPYDRTKYKVRKKNYSDWGDKETIYIECEVIKIYNYNWYNETEKINIWEFLKYYKQKVA